VGVVDDLLTVDQHRHPVLTGQIVDLGPVLAPLGHTDLLEVGV